MKGWRKANITRTHVGVDRSWFVQPHTSCDSAGAAMLVCERKESFPIRSNGVTAVNGPLLEGIESTVSFFQFICSFKRCKGLTKKKKKLNTPLACVEKNGPVVLNWSKLYRRRV